MDGTILGASGAVEGEPEDCPLSQFFTNEQELVKVDQPTKLSVWLEESGFTQAKLADTLKVSRQAVSKWCRGLNNPSLDYARAIVMLSANRLTVDDLIPAPENPLIACWSRGVASQAS